MPFSWKIVLDKNKKNKNTLFPEDCVLEGSSQYDWDHPHLEAMKFGHLEAFPQPDP